MFIMKLLCKIGLHTPKYWFFLDGCKIECMVCYKDLGFERHGAGICNTRCGH